MALWARLVGMDEERLWGGEGRWELRREYDRWDG
jgi:hypothetical protein